MAKSKKAFKVNFNEDYVKRSLKDMIEECHEKGETHNEYVYQTVYKTFFGKELELEQRSKTAGEILYDEINDQVTKHLSAHGLYNHYVIYSVYNTDDESWPVSNNLNKVAFKGKKEIRYTSA